MVSGQCKITVIRKSIINELIDEYLASPGNFKTCNAVEERQEFIVENPFEMPEGICPWAWADIRTYIVALASGSSFPFMEKKILSWQAVVTCLDL